MDFVRDKMALRVVKDHMTTRHDVARCVIKGGFVRGHSHILVNDLDVTAQMVSVFILFLGVGTDR